MQLQIDSWSHPKTETGMRGQHGGRGPRAELEHVKSLDHDASWGWDESVKLLLQLLSRPFVADVRE
eukprot:7900622-Heterocapsa_arctica.AAC.1